MKKIFLLSAILLIFLSGCFANNTKIENNACTCAGDNSGSMFWNVNGASEKPSVVWEYNEESIYPIGPYGFGNLNVCKNVVYAGGDRLTAINLKTGKRLWETQIKNSLPNENKVTYILFPTVYKDKIVAVGARLVVEKGMNYYFERRNILVFDRSTGNLLWKSSDIGAKLDYFAYNFPVVLNDKIYAPALNGEYRASEPGFGLERAVEKEERGIYVWDINTGKLVNKIILKFPEGYIYTQYSSVISDGRNIYMSVSILPTPNKTEYPTYVVAYDPVKRKIIWKTKVVNDDWSDSEVGTFAVNKKVIAEYCEIVPTKTHDGKTCVKVIDKNTGKILWSRNSLNNKISLSNNRIIFQTSRTTISCCDDLTGKTIWQYKCCKSLPNKGIFANFYPSVFATKDVVYLVDEQTIVALNSDTGKMLWIKTFLPPYSKTTSDKNADDLVWGSYKFIPVNNGFATISVVVYRWSGGTLKFPPSVELWLSNIKK